MSETKTETVAEFLKRGGKVTKVEGIPEEAWDRVKPRPSDKTRKQRRRGR